MYEILLPYVALLRLLLNYAHFCLFLSNDFNENYLRFLQQYKNFHDAVFDFFCFVHLRVCHHVMLCIQCGVNWGCNAVRLMCRTPRKLLHLNIKLPALVCAVLTVSVKP